jgi:hypothetical protein
MNLLTLNNTLADRLLALSVSSVGTLKLFCARDGGKNQNADGFATFNYYGGAK